MTPKKSVEETKQALLDAGRRVFADLGFDGARVDRIAQEAGINKALINYHFGGKTELFMAIIRDFTEKLATDLVQAIHEDDDAETQMRCFIRFMATTIAHNPEFPRLLLFETQRIHRGQSNGMPKHLILVMQTLGRILENGKKEGVFKPLNPFFVHFHLMSSFAMYHVMRPIRESMRGRLPIPEEVFSTEAFNKFVEEQIIAGFRVIPGSNEDPKN